MNVKAFLCLMAYSPPISPSPTQLQISKREAADFRLNIFISAINIRSEEQLAKYWDWHDLQISKHSPLASTAFKRGRLGMLLPFPFPARWVGPGPKAGPQAVPGPAPQQFVNICMTPRCQRSLKAVSLLRGKFDNCHQGGRILNENPN